LKTQAILQHRSKKGQSAFRSTAHLSKGALGPAVPLEVDVGECLPAGIADDEASVGLLGGPR
jgi:hypothetical protein